MSGSPENEEDPVLCERPPFVYTPLEPGCIRLLSPATTSNLGEDLDGRSWNLETVCLDDPNLEYHALSYVWGSQAETFPICCNDQILPVHHNLYIALPYVARRWQNEPARPIWIDALCINQQDEEEKRTQIGMMSNLYRRAEHVWAWLGVSQHQEQMPTAIDLFPQILVAGNYYENFFPRGQNYKELTKALRDRPWKDYPFVTDARLRNYAKDISWVFGLDDLKASVWAAVLHVLKNDWFSRLWVVQEAALARKLTFICGDCDIAYGLLERFMKSAHQLYCVYDAQGTRVNLHGQSVTVFETRKTVREFQQDSAQTAGSVLFNGTYLASITQICSRPEDRILGMLGLIERSWAANAILDIDALLKFTSITELYTKFTATILTKALPNTNALWWIWLAQAFANRSERRTDLPSWVPDFHHLHHKFGHDRQKTGDIVRYQASKREDTLARCGSSVEQLILRGIIFDTVLDVYPEVPSVQEDTLKGKIVAMAEWERKLAGSVLERMQRSFRLSKGRTHLLSWNDYWRTLLGDVKKPEITFEFMIWYHNFRSRIEGSFKDTFNKMFNHQIRSKSLFKNIDENTPYHAMAFGTDIINILTEIHASLTHKQLFLTKQGRFGFADKGVLPGDRLCIFDGAPTAHAIRRASDADASATWRFHGTAYVHGMMNGEVYGMGLETRDIVMV